MLPFDLASTSTELYYLVGLGRSALQLARNLSWHANVRLFRSQGEIHRTFITKDLI